MLLRSLLISVLLVTTLVGCGQTGTEAENAAQRLAVLGRDLIHRQEVVTPEELADWIIKQKQDFILLDVRSQKAFQAGHIQGARNVPLTYLFEAGSIESLPEDRMIVLYSEATRKATAATTVLRLAGRHAYLLEQGYEGWQDRVLHPRQIPGEGDKALQKRIAVSCYFGGNYKTDTAIGYTPPVQPAPSAAGSTTESPKEVRRKRRKLKAEGC